MIDVIHNTRNTILELILKVSRMSQEELLETLRKRKEQEEEEA